MPDAIKDPYFAKFGSFLQAVTLVFADVARGGDVEQLNYLIEAIYQIALLAKMEMQREGEADN